MSTQRTSRSMESALGSVLACGALALTLPTRARAEQFVLVDTEFTLTKEMADQTTSHWYARDLNPERPVNWNEPVDYRNGTVHIRQEILDKPAGSAISQWTLCYIAENEDFGASYGCTGLGTFTEAGVIEDDLPMKFWQDDQIDWSMGIKEMHFVLKDQDGSTGFANENEDWEKWLPTRVRITMVQVSEGSTYDPSILEEPDDGAPLDAGVVDPPDNPEFDGGPSDDGNNNDEEPDTPGTMMGNDDMMDESGNGNAGGNTDESPDEPTPETAAEDASGCSVGTMGTTASTHVGAMALGLSALIARARPRKRSQSA